MAKVFSVRRWLRLEWSAAVFVAAAVLIAHHHEWLDGVDGYAFVVIGNLGAGLAAMSPRTPGDLGSLALTRAIAVEIDQARFEDKYLGRSPLNRCRLREDLSKLYDARPELLVVDLDLSPALWIMKEPARKAPVPDREDEIACERDLHRLIKDRAHGVKTVLMSPFEIEDQEGSRTKEHWKCGMEASGVRFGNAHIPVRFGLALRSDAGPDSLTGKAHAALEDRPGPTPHGDKPMLVDPRMYRWRGGVGVVSLSELDANAAKDSRSGTSNAYERYLGGRIVFFGAGYGGEEDTFLTPGGEFYGVEHHAAALLSRLDSLSQHYALDFIVDLVFAFSFGLAMLWMRCQHHHLRSEHNRAKAELAGALVLLFGVIVVVLTFCSVWLSLQLLRQCGIWSSPVPVMIGMLIHSLGPAEWLEGSEASREPARHGWKARAMGLIVFVFGDSRDLGSQGLWGAVAAPWVTVRSVLWWGVVGYAVVLFRG